MQYHRTDLDEISDIITYFTGKIKEYSHVPTSNKLEMFAGFRMQMKIRLSNINSPILLISSRFVGFHSLPTCY